ncbi:hypothetical protein JXI42_13485 [bacterium]|nr:hypothetical protein [bacterium]
MKKFLTLLLVLALASFLFLGCEEDTGEEVIGAPTGLTITAGGNETSLVLTWTAPSTGTAEKYLIYFEGDLIDSVDAPTTTKTLTPNALGEYKVSAVSEDGEEGNKSGGSSTELVEQISQGPIYWISDPSPTHPSAYGWTTDGSGATYSAQEANQGSVDFYLDADFDIASPSRTTWSNPHTTGMKLAGTSYADVTLADASGYVDYEEVVNGGTYFFWVHDSYYVKLQITAYDAVNHSITFKYGFQRIANFRRLGDD